MSDKEKSAELILKLYDLRREETMRKARTWMITFMPETVQDVIDAYTGEHSAYIRMVTTYWDMACSLVNHGAIDEEMFNDANGEHVFIFAKIQPFVEQIRAQVGPRYLPHLEKLVMRLPDAEKRLEDVRKMAKQMAERRAAAEAERAQADAANA